MEQYVPAYKLEAPKLLKLLMFNYLFSNGDAHFKNFSLLETPMGDYRLSPAYDLLNSRIHIKDNDFALDDGLLPKNLAQGKIRHQFSVLAEQSGISEKVFEGIAQSMISESTTVEKLTLASFLDETTQRNYLQSYQARLKQLMKD
jgi:serine/threonine-protein kinase HipA